MGWIVGTFAKLSGSCLIFFDPIVLRAQVFEDALPLVPGIILVGGSVNQLVVLVAEVLVAVIAVNGGWLGAELANIDLLVLLDLIHLYLGFDHVG